MNKFKKYFTNLDSLLSTFANNLKVKNNQEYKKLFEKYKDMHKYIDQNAMRLLLKNEITHEEFQKRNKLFSNKVKNAITEVENGSMNYKEFLKLF